MCKCDQKRGAMNAEVVWWTNCKRAKSTRGFCSDQGGRFGMRKGVAAKREWSTAIVVNIFSEKKPGESGKRSCQQSTINDPAGWSLNDKWWTLNFKQKNLCLMSKAARTSRPGGGNHSQGPHNISCISKLESSLYPQLLLFWFLPSMQSREIKHVISCFVNFEKELRTFGHYSSFCKVAVTSEQGQLLIVNKILTFTT